ncbi:hypothetical protein Aduo_012193 [Ancylostoma duodenale]
MLEGAKLSDLFHTNTTCWISGRALLAREIEVAGTDDPEQTSILVNVAGMQVRLNEDQVSAVNIFYKNYSILVVDSAYGAGKSLCTTVMAQEAVLKGEKILVAAVQNSALDVIGSKIVQLQPNQIRPVGYVNDLMANDPSNASPFALQVFTENFHETHRHLLSDRPYKKFKTFSDSRWEMREFMFTGVQRHLVTTEHKKLILLEQAALEEIHVLISHFVKGKDVATWSAIVAWCKDRNLVTELHIFDSTVRAPL